MILGATPPEPVQVKHFLDNRGVISRIEKGKATRRLTPNHRLQPEQDVIDEIVRLWYTLPVQIQFNWVRGHQDRSKPLHQLLLEAQLNCEADREATQFVWPIDRNRNEIPSDPPKRHVYNAATVPTLLQFLQKKYRWDDTTVQRIDWTNYVNTIKKYNDKWSTLVKHVHDISPTGHIAHRNNSHLPHECPACNQPQEDNLHVITCPHITRANWRTNTLHKLLRHNPDSSDPHLADLLQDGIRRFHLQHEPPTHEEYPQQYHILIISQNQIGWDQLYKGRWSIHWSKLQDMYKESHHATQGITPGPQWVLQHGRLLIDQWMILWKQRNEERHGKDNARQQELREHIAKSALEELYAFKRQVCPSDRHIFYSSPAEHLEKHSLSNIEDWINTYHNAIKSSATQAKKFGLQQNRTILDYPMFNPNTELSGQAHNEASWNAG